MNLKLNERNAEIAAAIPKNIRSVVLNSVLARACEAGLLEQELSVHLSSSSLQEVLEKISLQKKDAFLSPKKRRGRPKKEKMSYGIDNEQETKSATTSLSSFDDENIFVGFDD